MRRAKDDSRCHARAIEGISQNSSTCDTNPGTKTTSIGPSPITW
jgi:hypothetical protein